MKVPKISIITVCYNSEDTIEESLISVANQTHENCEHIVIDGASTDDTMKIVNYHQERLVKIVSEPDGGIYDAMNKGIKLATGDIIGILNSDDNYYDNTILEAVANKMQNNRLDAVYGDVQFFKHSKDWKNIRRYSSAYFKPERLSWGWMPAHPTLFLKRKIYEQYGLFKTDYKIASDFEFIARIFGKNSIRYEYLPEVLVRMRLGGISTGGIKNTLLLNREVLKACSENGISTNLLKIYSKYPRKVLEYLRS